MLSEVSDNAIGEIQKRRNFQKALREKGFRFYAKSFCDALDGFKRRRMSSSLDI